VISTQSSSSMNSLSNETRKVVVVMLACRFAPSSRHSRKLSWRGGRCEHILIDVVEGVVLGHVEREEIEQEESEGVIQGVDRTRFDSSCKVSVARSFFWRDTYSVKAVQSLLQSYRSVCPSL
jgi:hypothetical protein